MIEDTTAPATSEPVGAPVQPSVRRVDDDDDMGAYWRDVKAARQAKRADNRKSSPELLQEASIQYTTKNGGAHLIVRTDGGHVVDFWPGTGLWIMRGSTQRHGGVRKLIKFCKPQAPNAELTGRRPT